MRDRQNITPIASATRLTVERRKAAVEDKLFNYKETYLAAEAELKRLIIRAPVSGAVVASGVHTIGGMVKADQTILQIVPSGDALVVEARVRPPDVDNILGHSGDESIRLLLSTRLRKTGP